MIRIDEELRPHSIAEIFPKMGGDEYNALKADIAANGLLDPICLYEGKILDGRHRYAACLAAGVAPSFREYKGDDPVGFVVSLNLIRRHLSTSQRSAVAAELANMRQGQRTDLPSANLPNVSQAEAANLLNVSTRSVTAASKVKDESPELFAALKSGDISAHLAAQVLELPQEDRAAIEALPPEKIHEAAAEKTKKAHVANNSGNNEWYTPPIFIDAARQAMGGIDTDPASSEIANKTVQAGQFFTTEDDGLAQKWAGNVWLNPPYAQPLVNLFAQAVVEKYMAGEIQQACVLVNNATETAWFQKILGAAGAVCFPQSRIKFLDTEGRASGAPLQGQAILYLGISVGSFKRAFAGLGVILTHA